MIRLTKVGTAPDPRGLNTNYGKKNTNNLNPNQTRHKGAPDTVPDCLELPPIE